MGVLEHPIFNSVIPDPSCLQKHEVHVGKAVSSTPVSSTVVCSTQCLLLFDVICHTMLDYIDVQVNIHNPLYTSCDRCQSIHVLTKENTSTSVLPSILQRDTNT